MILETVLVGELEVNCYIVAKAKGWPAVVIDPGDDAGKIRRLLQEHRLTPVSVINTHGHFDHIGCDDEFGVPVYIHAQDASSLGDPGRNLSLLVASSPRSVRQKPKTVEDGMTLRFEGLSFEVLHTPGHTPGGICLLLKEPQGGIVFTGDTLFCGSVGRTDLPGMSHDALIKGIRTKLLTLPDDTVVYPGHGPSSTIGEEKKHNPFLA